MLFQWAPRMLNLNRRYLAATSEKGYLAALRRKTGYSISNCKKALEMYNYDINLAEKWLHEKAQSMGWAKATKLEGRATSQGLIGILIRGNVGAMVEINCETDFVARNQNFKMFVDQTSRVCASYTEMTEFDGDLWKLGFEAETLKHMKAGDGKTLGDHLALLIGSVGENAFIKRAVCFKTNEELRIAGYVHPAPSDSADLTNTTLVGKYGTLVAFRGNNIDYELQRNLCQHIIGLNPSKIGETNKDTPVPNKDDETCLIYQEYLIDPEKTVGDVLKENDVNIIDYQRFECGEIVKNTILEEEKLKN